MRFAASTHRSLTGNEARGRELTDGSRVTQRASTLRNRPPPPVSAGAYCLVGVLLFGATALALAALGRPLAGNAFSLWEGNVRGPGNSQHLSDWYSASHVIAGMLFCGVAWLRMRHWPAGWLYLMAIVAGAGWELVENTPFMIARYGQLKNGFAYGGDSIVNALGDVGFTLLGFWLARSMRPRASIATGTALELAAALVIRDNLTLNLIMFAHPIEAIRTWQAIG